MHPIDVYVGARVKQRRASVRISQTELGKHLGVTFQQIQKYERGANRISASKLFEISNMLNVPVAWFFEGANEIHDSGVNIVPADENARRVEAFIHSRAGVDLCRDFTAIKTAKVQSGVARLIKGLAGTEGDKVQ